MTLTVSDVFFVVAAILLVIEFLQNRSLTTAALACIAVGLILLT